METLTKTDSSCCKMKSIEGHCPKPLESLSSFLSKKWTISIIMTIGNFRRLRFNNLKERLEKATAKILSSRLRELEKEGIIQRRIFKETPRKVEYFLTEKGNSLLRTLRPLVKWAERN